jgi:hypothetical protein
MDMIAAEIARGARRDAPAIAICLAYVLTLSVIFHAYDVPLLELSSVLANIGLYVAAIFMMVAMLFLWSLARARPDSPFSFAKAFAREVRFLERLVPAIPVFLAFALFMPSFSAAKSAIPLFSSYRFDALFTQADIRIHGQDAWRVLQPLVGYPVVSFALNGLYHLWVLLLYMGLPLVYGWLGKPDVRLQFLIAHALSWIVLGTVMATWLASVGPCFAEPMLGDAHFRPLMAYLHAADRSYPLMALDVQQTLIDWKQAGSHGLGRGISAMPSMHVAIASLFAILGWRHSRALGIALTLFLLLILIGSIHLGYHYAVDGYLSMIVTPILWAVSGTAARAWMGISANQSR